MKTDFEKDLFKRMNNAVFGKTIENVRSKVNIRLATSEEQIEKLLKQSSYKTATIFSEHLVAVHMLKTQVKLNKPVYLGMSILDLSKTFMYDFFYDYVKPTWNDKANLLMTDTDSLI